MTYDEAKLRKAIAAQRAVTRSGYRGDGVEVEPDELEALLNHVVQFRGVAERAVREYDDAMPEYWPRFIDELRELTKDGS